MKPHIRVLLFLLAALLCLTSAACETPVRIATYNIKWFNKEVGVDPKYGDRLEKLEQVIELLEADIIALQEIEDRDALKKLFPENEWYLIIDDEDQEGDKKEKQDLALAVRHELELPDFTSGDYDADNDDFLFPEKSDDTYFPGRRDVLRVRVRIPDEEVDLWVMVVHAKSRYGGRKNTDWRRAGAAKKLVAKLKADYPEARLVLLGDFNDNPDDQSLNILETGNPNALGGLEEIPGPFLVNLTEPLVAADHVSHGLKSDAIEGDRLNTVCIGSRKENNDLRGTNETNGDILFDQILIPAWMVVDSVEESCKVFDYAVASKGNDKTRASDHVPVYADFVFEMEPSPPETETGLWIVALLPNPVGKDDYNEKVTLRNTTGNSINLSGWLLIDKSNNKYNLSGEIPAATSLTITLNRKAMLNNTGDTVWLEDGNGEEHSKVTYTSSQAKSGETIAFD